MCNMTDKESQCDDCINWQGSYALEPCDICLRAFSGNSTDFYKPFKANQKDPNGLSPHDAGAKLDADKPDMSLLLLFGKALYEVSRVGTGGKIKYSRGGWQSVEDGINRYTAAMLRHLFEEPYNEMDADLVSYLGNETYHAAHTAWNALARLELILREKDAVKKMDTNGIV